jgi:glycosyltransferase involved in cell wall biosynthesis
LRKLPSKEKWRVKIWNWLEKEELRALVANVDWVIAPSLSEWFWSVHTETLALWTPLVTTYVASLPEVAWGDVVFFAPDNIEELCKAVHKLKVWEYKKLEERRFSWDEQYAKLLEWYKSL